MPRVWRSRFPGVAHHYLQTRLHHGQRKIELFVPRRGYDNRRGDDLGSFGEYRVEERGGIRTGLVVRLHTDPRRDRVPEIDTESG
jgi:hypothetical protein